MKHPLETMSQQEVQVHLDEHTGILDATLSPTYAAMLASLLRRHDTPAALNRHEHVSEMRWLACRTMPANLLRLIDAINAGRIAPTCVVIRGLPSDSVAAPPAPTESPRDVKPSCLSENLLLFFGSMLGEPYGIAGEGCNLINELIPTLEDRDRLTGNGSRRKLGLHVENAAWRRKVCDHELCPHALLLTGVVSPGAQAPKTLVANGRAAAASLSAKHRRILRSACVRLALPERHRHASRPMRTEAGPVLTGRAGCEVVTAAFYGDMMKPVSVQAKEALAAFEAALEAHAVGITITPGVMVYIPNRYTLHGRDAFVPEFSSEGRASRWVQRVFLTTRLDTFAIGEPHGDRVFELPAA